MTAFRDAPPRVEAALKVTGAARFPAETPVDEMLHACLVVAPIARGRVLAIDAARARACAGFVQIFTHENLPPLRPASFLMLLREPIIHFAGQPIALVVGETPWQAAAAATAVAAAYEPSPPITTVAQAVDQAFAPKEAGRVATDSRRGDPERGLAEADMVIERCYTTPAHNHNPLEPNAVIASWNGDHVTVHTTTQAIFGTRRVVAHCFGLPLDQVRVLAKYVGGGFGAKTIGWFPCLVLCIAAARLLGRTLKLELTRPQMFTLVGRRQETVQHLKLGAARDGRLTAIVHDTIAQTSTFGEYADPNGSMSRWLYACDNVATSHRLVRVNAPQPKAMRAPGEGTGSFALESALDELAHELAMDPIELRLRNYADHDQHAGLPWSSKGLRECYRVAARNFGWERRPRAIGVLGEERYRLGWGMASACFPVYRMASEAAVRMDPDGRVLVRCGTQDIGTGTYTVLTQLAANTLGVPFGWVTAELGDTCLPEGPYSGAHLATASFAPAVEEAARTLRRRLIDMAVTDQNSPLYRLSADQVAIDQGYLRSVVGNQSEPLAELQLRVAPEGVMTFARATPTENLPYSASGYGAVFAEVCVDSELGEVRVCRLTAAYAAGRIVNPRLARSQIIGGLVFGIGMALHEATLMDERSGRIVNDNFGDYLVPVHADMPQFDIHLIDEDDPCIEAGIKGIGMLSTVGVAAAIANAVFHATGRRVRDLPIRLEHCLPGSRRASKPERREAAPE